MAADDAPESFTESLPERTASDEPVPPSRRDEPEGPPSRLASEVRAREGTLRCTLAALGSWLITVAPLVVTGRAGVPTRILALLALVPGIAGPQLIAKDHRLARHTGVTAYLAFVVGAWALASSEQVLARVDAFRAVLGALAWAVFALAWSHPWSVPDRELALAPEGATAGLKPRRKPPVRAVAVAVVGAVIAVACLALGWTVTDPDRAVLAQAGATAAAIAMLTSASTIAVLLGREKPRDGRRRKLPIDRKVVHSMLLMVVLGALAVLLYVTK